MVLNGFQHLCKTIQDLPSNSSSWVWLLVSGKYWNNPFLLMALFYLWNTGRFKRNMQFLILLLSISKICLKYMSKIFALICKKNNLHENLKWMKMSSSFNPEIKLTFQIYRKKSYVNKVFPKWLIKSDIQVEMNINFKRRKVRFLSE